MIDRKDSTMTTTGIHGLDKSIEIANIWLDEMMEELYWSDKNKGYRAMRVVLAALRDRLPVTEAAHLASQLPMLLRGMFYDGWQPLRNTETKKRSKKEFLELVNSQFSEDYDADDERIVRACFRTLTHHVSAGEIKDVQRVMPDEFMTLWI
jgi:uncharacterized protein (DUF2267 family)